MNRSVRAVPILLVLAGCSLAPELKQPEVEVPARFKELPPAEQGAWKPAQPSEELPRGQWWKVFNDPVLDRLEDDATAANQKSAGGCRARGAGALARRRCEGGPHSAGKRRLRAVARPAHGGLARPASRHRRRSVHRVARAARR